MTDPTSNNTTTNQIALFEKGNHSEKSSPAFDKTMMARNINMTMFTKATILIFGGYLPGYFPPIEAAPQGIPAARQAWKIITTPVRTVKICADRVTDMMLSSDLRLQIT